STALNALMKNALPSVMNKMIFNLTRTLHQPRKGSLYEPDEILCSLDLWQFQYKIRIPQAAYTWLVSACFKPSHSSRPARQAASADVANPMYPPTYKQTAEPIQFATAKSRNVNHNPNIKRLIITPLFITPTHIKRKNIAQTMLIQPAIADGPLP